MKAFFNKASESSSRKDAGQAQQTPSGMTSSTSNTSIRSLGPQFTVPPFPQPLPERCLSLHHTAGGLLILPCRKRLAQHEHHHRGKHAEHAPVTSAEAGQSGGQDVASDANLASAFTSKASTADDCGPAAAKISWSRNAAPVSVGTDESRRLLEQQGSSDSDAPFMLCYGIVGILRVFNAAYLLVITSRGAAGDYLRANQPVYRCTGVLPIPLTASGAKDTITREMVRQQDGQKRLAENGQESDSSDDDDDSDSGSDTETPDDVKTPAVTARPENPFGASLGAEAALRAIQSKSAPHIQTQISAKAPEKEEASADTEAPQTSSDSAVSAEKQWHDAARAELEDKVVKETARQYARGEMWFTYDFDLTTPVQRKQDALEKDSARKETTASNQDSRPRSSSIAGKGPTGAFAEPWATLPLWRRADRRFWHNEHLARDFAKAGLHSLVLPMMQGFFQVADLPLHNRSPAAAAFDPAGDAMSVVSDVASSTRLQAQLLIVSRRSKERAGLRYQRRGVNEQGQVANFVESEQILVVRRGSEETHVFSFLQFRGSIPLFWRQDPFSMKPPPQLEGSPEENARALSRHFEQQVPRYEKVICINLAEQHGKEGAITKAYQEGVEKLAHPAVKYKAFDFHEECKGMRFERVGNLIDDLKNDEIKDMDCFWKSLKSDGTETVYSRQHGAFRVSCLDCLDRTNVVQSAFARHLLTTSLERLGVHIPEDKLERDEAFDFAFNDSWANNGDMISQIYAGTRALKGDFTRTGKRNLMGMMNDATNSVYRMVRGAVSDFFKQTVIDFQYGYSSLTALERYNDDLVTPDPAETNRLARVRAIAIDACARNVVHNDEKVLASWTLFSPIEPNRIETPKLEEKVVLLSTKALYSCGFDFTSHKVAEFSRILLGDIVGIKRGVYILAPHEGYHTEDHWGLVVTYLKEERRLNTASIRSVPDRSVLSPGATNFVAFRAVVDDASSAEANMESSSRFLESAERTLRLKTSSKSRNDTSLLARLSSAGRRTASEAQPAGSQSQAHTRSVLSVAPHVPTSHDIIDSIVEAIIDQCILSGACNESDADFVKEETIQSLAQAKASASYFAPLIEGLKRRVWL